MTFRQVLTESLHALRDEVPEAHAALCRRLAPRAVRLRVDDESSSLRLGPDGVALDADGPRAVEVDAARTTIIALVAARHSLVSAVLAEALVMRGRLDDLLAFHDGLVSYLQGAVRGASFPDL